MKVILIEEDRFADLVSTLELERHKLEVGNTANILHYEIDEIEKEMHLHVERTIATLRSGIEREVHHIRMGT